MDQFFPKIPFEAFGQMKIKQEYSGNQHHCDPQRVPYDSFYLPHKT